MHAALLALRRYHGPHEGMSKRDYKSTSPQVWALPRLKAGPAAHAMGVHATNKPVFIDKMMIY